MRSDTAQAGYQQCTHQAAEQGQPEAGCDNTAPELREAPAGATRWTVAQKPSVDAVSLASWSIGIALVSAPHLGGERAYLCDSKHHRIDVLDHQWRPLFSFGGHGAALGQFDTPSDISIVWLADPADEATDDPTLPEMAVLAVADLGNHRIQLFELDGSPIGEVKGESARLLPDGGLDRACAPFFRVGTIPRFPMPSRLDWHAPFLEIVCARGAVVRLDLAAAVLPDFRTWIRDASVEEVRNALESFTKRAADVPAACLEAMRRRLLVGGFELSMGHAA
jgi:hypothetical protein